MHGVEGDGEKAATDLTKEVEEIEKFLSIHRSRCALNPSMDHGMNRKERGSHY